MPLPATIAERVGHIDKGWIEAIAENPKSVPAPVGGSDEYPADPADSNFRRWFLPNLPFQSDNEVITYTEAAQLWIAMQKEINKATNRSHFVYIIGRNLGMNTNMDIGAPSSVELSQLLKTADAKDVQIRAILELLRENDCASRYIEGLASGNCAVVSDAITKNFSLYPIEMGSSRFVAALILKEDGQIGTMCIAASEGRPPGSSTIYSSSAGKCIRTWSRSPPVSGMSATSGHQNGR